MPARRASRASSSRATAIVARDFGADGDRLNFAWSLGYLNADYLEFIDARGIDVADRREVQNTPEWTASGTLNYGVPVASRQAQLHHHPLLPQQQPAVRAARRRASTRRAIALWDANLVWRSDDDRWTIGLHGRNLTDKRYITSGYNFLAAESGHRRLRPGQRPAGQLSPDARPRRRAHRLYGNPRQVFLTVGFNFR